MVKLREKGIERPKYLEEFDAENVSNIADALREPGEVVPSGSSARA